MFGRRHAERLRLHRSGKNPGAIRHGARNHQVIGLSPVAPLSNQNPKSDFVAVGTALAGGPPHRSGRAELPHPALALGNNANAGRRVRMITTFTPILHPRLTYPLKRVEHAHPALCPGHVTLGRFPLGQPPSLHHLLSLRLGLVRRLCRYYGAVRLPVPVHHRRASLDFPMRPPSGGRHRISRFPLKVLTYMHRVLDRAESKSVSRYRRPQFCLPTISTASAPRSGHRLRGGVSISRLNTWPIRTPVNASPAPLRTPMHDSEPVRIANPSPYETFIHNTLPVFTGAPKSETNRSQINIKLGKSKTPNLIRVCFEFRNSRFGFVTAL